MVVVVVVVLVMVFMKVLRVARQALLTARIVLLACVQGAVSVTEMLYRHKDTLETIFRIFDKDNSGFISMTEFEEACGILSKHASIAIPQSHITDIAHSLDLNKDGQIDFNEFLEAFRIVNMGGDVGFGQDDADSPTISERDEMGNGDGGVQTNREGVLEIEDLELDDGHCPKDDAGQNNTVSHKL